MTSPSGGSEDLLQWLKRHWKTINRAKYSIWTDQNGELACFGPKDKLIFFFISPDKTLTLLNRDEARDAIKKLALELRLRVRRGRPGPYNRTLQAHSARMQRLLRNWFGQKLETWHVNTYVERTYGLNAQAREHDQLLPDLAENQYKPYNNPPGTSRDGTK